MFCNIYLTSLLFRYGFYINSIRSLCARNVSLASVKYQKITFKTENTISSNNGTSEINIDVLHTESDKTESVSNQKTSKHCEDINQANKQNPKKRYKVPDRIIADNKLFGKLIKTKEKKYAQSMPEQTKSKKQSIEHLWILKVSKPSEVKYIRSPKMKDMKNDKVTDNKSDTSNKLGDIELQNTSVDALENLSRSTNNSEYVIPNETLDNILSFPIVSSDRCKKFYIDYKEKNEKDKTHVPFVKDILIETMSIGTKMLSEMHCKNMVKKLGQDHFDTHNTELLKTGKLLHFYIADALKEMKGGNDKRKKEQNNAVPTLVKSGWESFRLFLNKLQTIEEIDKLIWHPNLQYRTKIDCIAWYRGKLCLFDWKVSYKRKTDYKSLFETPIKLAACIGAVNASDSNPYMIDTGYIVSGHVDGTPPIVHKVSGHLLKDAWLQWLTRLHVYHKNLRTTSNLITE